MNDTLSNSSGYLIFSTFITRFKKDNSEFSDYTTELLRRLPNYSEGSPNDPRDGYDEIELLDQAHFESELPDRMIEDFKKWVCIRYYYENYDSQEAFIDEEKRVVQIRSIETVDFFFHPSGVTLLRGTTSAIRHATSRIQQLAEGDFLFEKIEINLQDIYKYSTPSQYSDQYDLIRKQSKRAKFQTSSSNTSVSVTGGDIFSNDLVREANQRGRMISFRSEFQFEDFLLDVDIKRNRIFVRAMKDIRDLPDSSRLVLSILFCFQILEPQVEVEKETFK